MSADGSVSAAAADDAADRPRALTVLVVEDDPEVRRLAVRALERAGYVVLSTGYAEEAIEMAEGAGPVDALVTDVILPNLSGIGVATRVRLARPHIPILFMSGHSMEAVAGATDFIAKPFLPSELVAAVEGVLRRPASGEERPEVTPAP